MKKRYFFILTTVFLVLALMQVTLAISPEDIGDWWGTVTINGAINDYGAVVDAYINGEKVASDIVGTPDVNYYLIHVPGKSGDKVTFKVYGIIAKENIDWGSGSYRLDLSINKLTDGSSCEYDKACLGVYCCSGICSSQSCPSPPPSGPSGGNNNGGGGGGGGSPSGGSIITNQEFLEPGTETSPQIQKPSEEEKEQEAISSGITGGVTGFIKSGAGVITIFASLIAIIGAFIVVKLKLVKKRK